MKPEELGRFRIEVIELQGVIVGECPRFVTYGIHGAGEFITGICFGETVMQREPHNQASGTPEETTDALTIRAARALAESAPKTAAGSAIGFYIYSGLPEDHCKQA